MTDVAHVEIDTAKWSPAVLAAAQVMGASAINFYAYDPDVPDVGGWCGGWTPGVVAQIRDAGILPRPIFGFRPAGGLPTYARCLQILQALGIQPGEAVLTDREADLVPEVSWQVGFNQALAYAKYLSGVYGNADTLNDGCLAYCNVVWLANWGDSPPWSPLPAIEAMPAFTGWAQRSWQYSHDQVVETAQGGATVDVSISTITAPPAPAPTPVSTSPVTILQEDSMDRLVITAYPNPKPSGQALVNLDRGTFLVLQETTDVPALEGLGIPTCELSGATVDQLTQLKPQGA